MTQLSLVDALINQHSGLAAAEANDRSWIDRMREIAREICRQKGSVNVDDLRVHCSIFAVGHPVSAHAWGAIFKQPGWKGNRPQAQRIQ